MIIRYIRSDVRLLGRERKSKIRKGEFLLFRDMVLKDFWLQQTLGHGTQKEYPALHTLKGMNEATCKEKNVKK